MRSARAAASRVFKAINKRPKMRDWREAAMLWALVVLTGAPIAAAVGLFSYAPMTSPASIAATALIVFFIPAFAEEVVFRAALVTGRLQRGKALAYIRRAFVPLGLFVLWHPLQAGLGAPWASPVFVDPVFLMLAALLGAACTLSYARSHSLWPPVALHWGVVMTWKLATGG